MPRLHDFKQITRFGFFELIRIINSTVPRGYHRYEIRHADDDWGEPVHIARGILVNHYGTLITRDEIKLPAEGYISIEPDALNFGIGDCRDMKSFMEQYPSKIKLPKNYER